MITKKQIDQFYKDVASLDVKFLNASVAKVTGESKGNVSKILNRKMEPSEVFIKKFYDGFKFAIEDNSKVIKMSGARSDVAGIFAEDIIKLKATVEVLTYTVAELRAGVTARPIVDVLFDLDKSVNNLTSQRLDELRKKSELF